MMTREQFLLIKLAEGSWRFSFQRCPTSWHSALKAAQFGLDEVQPGQFLDNETRLAEECADLDAIRELLNEEFNVGRLDLMDEWIAAKKIKLEEYYYQLSRSLGKVE